MSYSLSLFKKKRTLQIDWSAALANKVKKDRVWS